MAVADWTEQLPLDDWRIAVNDTLLPLNINAVVGDPFRGTLRTTYVGSLQLTEVSAMPEHVRRTAKHVAADDNDHYAVALQLRDCSIVRQDGREVRLTPGELVIYDCTRPYEFILTEPHGLLIVLFEREAFSLKPDEVARVTASRVIGDRGVGALTRTLLLQLGNDSAQYPEYVAKRISALALDMVATLYAQHLREHPVTGPQAALVHRIKAFVDDHLGDSELSPESIASAHFISVRYLHKLFEHEDMTVSNMIRRRRLDRCRQDLTDPLKAAWTIGEIAAHNGLTGASHFSQLFRAEFGESPSTYRRRIAAAAQ